jgi:glucose/mannose-6-phosphate isomerase
MTDLDDVRAIAKADPGEMRERIRDLPQQCATAWQLWTGPEFTDSHRAARSVVILGMGGSAIGGALLDSLVAGVCKVPIACVGGYNLPVCYGEQDLVIASSYSGNTEETLSAFEQAVKRQCNLAAVTTGGRLGELAAEMGIPCLRFEYESAPRAALGYSFTLLLSMLCRLGFISDQGENIEQAVIAMNKVQKESLPGVPADSNPAKLLSGRLLRQIALIYGAGFLGPVGRRWKGQCNENAKSWAFWEELPELNHNAVVAYEMAEEVQDWATVVLLRSELDAPRIKARWDITQDLLHKAGMPVETVWGRGEGRLAQMFSLIHLGDYVSYYLALLKGVDPTPVSQIDYLKARLSEIKR